MNIKDILKPVENRIVKEPVFEQSSLLRAFSIVSPEIVYYVISSVVTYIAAIAMAEGVVLPNMSDHSKGLATLVRALAVIIAVVPLILPFRNENPLILPKSENKGLRIAYVVLAGISSAIFFNIAFSMLMITQNSDSYAKVQDNQFSLPLGLGLLMYGIITPVTEEIVHRGIIFNRLRRYFNLPIAFVFGPLLFGISHGNMVQLLYGFSMGVFISYVYEKYGAFLYPVLFHCAANMIVYTVSSFETFSKGVYNATGLVISGFVMVLMFCMIAKEKTIDTTI